jgi:hypothetical protein
VIAGVSEILENGVSDMNSVFAAVLFFMLASTQIVWATDVEASADAVGLEIAFKDGEKYDVKPEEVRLITDIISSAEKKVRELLPDLPEDISVTVTFVDKDFNYWGTSMGLNGQTDAPGVVGVEISTRYPGGIAAAVNKNLSRLIYHEFHHLMRGWTMTGNKFGPGLTIATVNEGLAVVFSELYADGTFEDLAQPDDGEKWLKEILALPLDANYGVWMNLHPDGRFTIGYRTGMYVVNRAITVSGKDIFELSKLSPDEILELAEVR